MATTDGRAGSPEHSAGTDGGAGAVECWGGSPEPPADTRRVYTNCSVTPMEAETGSSGGPEQS